MPPKKEAFFLQRGWDCKLQNTKKPKKHQKHLNPFIYSTLKHLK